MKSLPEPLRNREKPAKFKHGERVFADTLGKGVVLDSYFAETGKKERLYHIKQDGFTLGNIPESWIVAITERS